ncbi:MAG: Ig-like domain-containing protein [Parcubacteria group bacterium]|nr:Ig-like domain-containing protein [Parcubacteria group bacterium]
MKRLIVFVLAIFVTTIFSGCMPTNQAEQSLDFVFGKPRVSNVEPKNGAEDIDLNSEIKITFNKEIDEATLNNKNININYLNKDLSFNVNPFLGSEYKYENKTLTIKPNEEFLPNQLIEVRLTSDIKNREGDELSHSGRGGESDNIRYVTKFKTKK